MNPREYQTYITDPANGLTVHFSDNQTKMELTYLPFEWQAFESSIADGKVDQAQYEKFKTENSGRLVYSLKVHFPEQQSLEDYLASHYENYQDAMLYVEYEMKNDFKLSIAASTDSLEAMAVHYQPSFGLKPYEEFLILFDSNDEDIETKSLHLTFHDQIFIKNDIKLIMDTDQIQNLPNLKIK